MIDRDYLERLAAEFVAQIREYENNAAAARGALQVVQHLLDKIAGEAGASPQPTSDVVREKRENGTDTL